ncbi:hypothetical protein EUX98_g7216 [Antrodiella citrinella]|uniref:Peptidase A1 domain-containing protein n=1 Tax=Antrodiella citrinella TaxID=2447956 RepID=A0A4S4MM43_9APHY|nr:hypothetical protein EUX98_g7216 [Antrodiella citrinella]
MFSASSLIVTLTLALAVAANPLLAREPLVTLPFAKRVNVTGTSTLIQHDQARARGLKRLGQARAGGVVSDAVDVPATNELVDYVVNVGVGTPATTYSLLVDTGSSNTWVGAGKKFVKTSSSVQTKDRVSVTYGSGEFSGNEFTDTVTIGSLVIKGQSIGVATSSQGFSGVDGILGIGPVDLTSDTLSPDTRNTIPTVTDNLFSSGSISENLVAVSFEPTTSETAANGELTFGGTDSSKFTGSISFAPITGTSPASEFWGIDQSVTYGTNTNILSSTAGIVDTGTTLTLLASDALAKYQKATGAVNDNATGLLKLTTAQFNNLQSLFFNINGQQFELTANAQIWPRNLNTAIGGSANSIYLIVGDLGTDSGEGLDFINGQTFLERFYAVFDTANKRVGLATTSFTQATTN